MDDIFIIHPGDSLDEFEKREFAVAILPQAQVGPYFLDFCLIVKCKNEQFKFDIECDGKEFHSGSIDIVEYDRRRDQYVQNAGYYVWRMTGSEINKNPLIATQKLTEKIGEIIEYKRS